MYTAGAAPEDPASAAQAAAEAAEASASARALSEFAKTTSTYRVHQEDICQALSVHPSLRYQNDGGPGPRDIADLLRVHTHGARRSKDRNLPAPYEEDVATFTGALILNWLIGGTDAHAKNYSLLIGGGGLVRLAPLYDLASICAHPTIDPGKAKLAMKLGGEYRLEAIGLSQWRRLASELRTGASGLVDRVRAMATELPDRLADEVRRLTATGITHPVIDTLAGELSRRAAAAASL